MRGHFQWLGFALLAGTGATLVSLQGCGGGGASSGGTTPSAASVIKHVVVLVQENRTPDNLFHGLPNADIASSGVNSLGQTVTLTQVPLAQNYELSHAHEAFTKMYDGGKMDGADQVSVTCPVPAGSCPAPNAQFVYVDPSEVTPYFDLATQYTFADRMFQTNQGPSFPAHQYLIAGTSAPTAASDLLAAENPDGIPDAGSNTGCTAPAGEFVMLIDPMGVESSSQFPCFEHATLMDSLDAKGVSWKYYTPSAGSLWTAPNAIDHLRNGTDWDNVVLQETQVLTDIANGQLASVSWVIPNGLSSDHPMNNDGSGPSWVASVVNAIGGSPYWGDTAIFIVWDDWGGFYDHVAPQILDSYEYGFRVPLIVVSPYAKAGYVSHATHDFGSILKFIEEVFGVAPLGYADARSDDLGDCFDYGQAPMAFHPVAAKFGPQYFLERKGPPVDPDDD